MRRCATPDCQYCEEERAVEALEEWIIGARCEDTIETSSGPGGEILRCTGLAGHEGRHENEGLEWS